MEYFNSGREGGASRCSSLPSRVFVWVSGFGTHPPTHLVNLLGGQKFGIQKNSVLCEKKKDPPEYFQITCHFRGSPLTVNQWNRANAASTYHTKACLK